MTMINQFVNLLKGVYRRDHKLTERERPTLEDGTQDLGDCTRPPTPSNLTLSPLREVSKRQPGKTRGRYSHDKSELDALCEEVKRSLDIEALARNLLGPRTRGRHNQKELRFGMEGEISVEAETGLWKNFVTGEGGNMFTLVEAHVGQGFKQKLSYMRDYCDGVGRTRIDEFLEGKPFAHLDKEREEERAKEFAKGRQQAKEAYFREREEKLQGVNDLFRQKCSIRGTEAGHYLRYTRGIFSVLTKDLDEELGFLGKGTQFYYGGKECTLYYDSLVSFARNSQGRVMAAQVTALKDNKKAPIDIPKISYGEVTGSFVQVQKGERVLWLAEGVETALSLMEADVPGQIEASLGGSNLKNRDVQRFKSVVICADNDDDQPHCVSHQNVKQAENAFKAAGKEVFTVKPLVRGQDFNDMLLIQGRGGIKQFLNDFKFKDWGGGPSSGYSRWLVDADQLELDQMRREESLELLKELKDA